MSVKVEKVALEKESGWLYFLDKRGNISRVKMGRGKAMGSATPKTVVKLGVKREPGFLYFIDKQGDLSKAKMSRKGRKKNAKNKRRRGKNRKKGKSRKKR